jgi:hypothetical protein
MIELGLTWDQTEVGPSHVGLTPMWDWDSSSTSTLRGMDLGMGKANAADSVAQSAEAVLGPTALHEEGEGCWLSLSWGGALAGRQHGLLGRSMSPPCCF